ncbi:MAG: exo-alpha-sialidase [Chloroflexi bacterium]|jgi:predicted neuraminidase|nr:exo-alpha-sialidase [Chloroflexota bacterium]
MTPQIARLGEELIFALDDAPTPQCHASTIAETRGGLVAAWFGGTREGHPDVGIWLARNVGAGWEAPRRVAADARFPCWNPVLFQVPAGPLLLFYKVGPNPREWWGEWMSSADGGATWSEPVRLPEGVLGPIKNKPVLLEGQTLLSPSSHEDEGWRVYMERSVDLGATWEVIGPLNDPQAFGAIQPTILTHPDGRLQALCRTRQGCVAQLWSSDGGRGWSQMTAVALPNPNSGIDGVTLADGRQLLVYNHTAEGRTPLNVALSRDGTQWEPVAVLESQPGEYSYPAVIQASDGVIHITYTYDRRSIKHVALDPRGW